MIVMRDLYKTFVLGSLPVEVLKGITLEIKEHEFVAIMGPSGSGKTTLMNIIGCLDTPSRGWYQLQDTDISTLDDDQLSLIRGQTIGFVFQTFHLLPRKTALDNVLLPRLYTSGKTAHNIARARELLTDFNLGHRLQHLPHQLSGGEQQRVAIARALMNDPKIILADEPTGALDSNNGREVLQIFTQLNHKGKTIILVTHDAGIASHARRIIHLQDGKITA